MRTTPISIAGCFSNMMTFGITWKADEECGGQTHGSMEAGDGLAGEGGASPEAADTSQVCQPLQSYLHVSTRDENHNALAQEP